MNRMWFLPLVVLLVIPVNSNGAEESSLSAKQVFTLSGEAVHDVGMVGLNVTNFGLLGSHPGTNAPYASQPSLEYPLGSKLQNLWGAGIWIGGILGRIPHVSMGQYETQLLPDPNDPADTIYPSREGAPGGLRMPGVADDDGDGLIDEDPLNGFDDDGDGLIDEDFAAIGDQYFHAQMRDDTPLAMQMYPDHAPMGLLVQQESFAWSDSRIDDLIGVRYRVKNVGEEVIHDVFVGIFSDFDIGGDAENDLVGFLSAHLQSELSGDSVQVDVAYMADTERDHPYAGLILLNHRDSRGEAFSGMWSLHAFRGDAAFGGDPTNDAQRYKSLATREFVVEPQPVGNDYRILGSAGPFGDLAPGEELVFEFAFVMGENFQELVSNAANAVALARGRQVEYESQLVQVPWLLPEETGEELTGTLRGHWSAAGALLQASLSEDVPVKLVRRSQPLLSRRVWKIEEARRAGPWLQYRDQDEGPWPRKYVLKTLPADGSRVLARLTIHCPCDKEGPRPRGHGLRIFPNPFNPRTELQFTLDHPTRVKVEVFDLKGRRVRLLASGVLEARDHRLIFDGLDDGGAALASGLYFIRLSTPTAVSTARALLVR